MSNPEKSLIIRSVVEAVAIGNGSVVADAMPSKICNMSVIGEMFGVKISQISDNKFYYDY